MARPRRNIGLGREKIAREARLIILEQGESTLTMVALAKRLDMSVGNLYKFFDSKDELLLALFKGFYDELYAHLQANLPEGGLTDPAQFLELIRAYVHFADEQFFMYKVVMHPPIVYSDFIGTDLEPFAVSQDESTARVMDLTENALAQALALLKIPADIVQLRQRFIFLFDNLHGMLLMRHSRLAPLFMPDPEGTLPIQLEMLGRTLFSPLK